MEAEFWKWNGAYKYIDKIICCSEFLKTKMDTNPLFATKTIAMHNFVEKVEPKDVEFYTYNVVLLRGRTGLYHRMQSGGGVLVNPVAKFLGGICFEIYLCHMVIYRVLEKLHLVHLFGNGLLAYGLDYLCQHFAVCAKFFGLYDADCSIENHAPGTSHWRVL